jgi:type III restriction enzyme
MELRGVERGKIACAGKLFKELSNSKVIYHEVTSFADLRNLIPTL